MRHGYSPVLALTALCLIAGFWRLGSKSLWFDETVSATYAHMTFGGLWHVITGPDPNMSVYYVLLWVWGHIFGYGAFALRSLDVLLGCLSVPLIVAIGGRLFDRTVGLVAGGLLAISPCFVLVEQTARSYALVVLFTLLATYCFLRARDAPTPSRLTAYVAACVLGAYAHYFALIIIVVHALVVAMDTRQHRRYLTRWVACGAIILLAFIPEAVVAARHGQNTAWIGVPSVSALVRFPEFLAGSQIARLGTLATGLFVVCCIYQLVSGRSGRDSRSTWFVAAWLVIPVLLTFVESHLAQSFWQNDYMIEVLPAFLLLAAAGAVHAPNRQVAIATLVILGALQLAELHRLVETPQFENWQRAAGYVLTHESDSDRIIYVPGFSQEPFAYYARQDGHSLPKRLAPAGLLSGVAHPPRLWVVVKSNSAGAPSETRDLSRGLSGYVQSSAQAFAAAPEVRLYVTRN